MKVLIIEENEDRYKLIRESLHRVTHPFITWCRTGSSGLVSIIVRNVKKSNEAFDFVILDDSLTVNTINKANSYDTRYIVDEIRKLGLDDLPIVVCSSREIEDCDYNYRVDYNLSGNMDHILRDVLIDIDAHHHLKDGYKEIDLSDGIKTQEEKKNKSINSNEVLGNAILIRRTEIKDLCSNYDNYDVCNVIDCLYCDNCNYMIFLEEFKGIIKSLKSLYYYPKEHLNGIIDHDHEILFYDEVPSEEDLFNYLFDEDSRFKIVRKSDNKIIVDTTKNADVAVKKLVPNNK